MHYASSSPIAVAPAAKTTGASGITGHSVSLSSLTASKIYYYVVVSKDGSGNTTISSEQSFTTLTPPPPATPPVSSSFGPWITSLSISPTSGPPGTVITFTTSAEDPNGVGSIVVDIKYPGTSYTLRPNWNLAGATSGTQTFSESIDHGISPTILGEYVIESIRAADSLGNVSKYYPSGAVENSNESSHNFVIPSISIQ